MQHNTRIIQLHHNEQQSDLDKYLEELLGVECKDICDRVVDIDQYNFRELTFSKIEKLLNDVTQFEAKLNTRQKELKDSSDTDAQLKLKQIQTNKISVISYMIILKFKLASKHLEQAEVPSYQARKKPMHDACILANEGYDLALSIQDFYPKEELSKWKRVRDKLLASYEKEYGDSEISKLLAAAGRIKNKEEAEKKYQEALKLTTKPEKQYDILIKHSNANLLSFNLTEHTTYTTSAEAFESYFALAQKEFTPLVSAIQIILSVPSLSKNMTINLDDVFRNLRGITRWTIAKCQSKLYENDLTGKHKLYESAREYVDLTNKLIKKVNKSDDEWEKVNKKFLTEYGNLIKEIIKKKAEEKKQKEQNEKSRQAMNSYLETFDNMIKQFESENKHKSVSRTPKKSGNVVDGTAHDTDDDDDNTIYEINLEQKPQPIKFEINLDEQLNLLKQAEKNGDLIQQFKINVLVAEYYKIKSDTLDVTSEISSAKNHITTADKIIDQIKQDEKLTSNIMEFEKGMSIVLENITASFKKFVLREQRIKKELEDQHERVKQDIIAKKGNQAWIRNDVEAIERQAGINELNEARVNELKLNWREMRILSAKYIHALYQYRLLTDADEVTQTTTQSSTDPVPAEKIERTLIRSKSSHSFFNEKEINHRKVKRQLFEFERNFDLDRSDKCSQVLYNSITAKRKHN